MKALELLQLALEGKLTKEFILEENLKAYIDTYKHILEKAIREEKNEN